MEKIKPFFEKYRDVAVAFSGGVDSAVLLFLAKKYAKSVKAYFVKSQFQPAFELDDAFSVCNELGAELEIIPLDVISDNNIVSNTADRCYYCKTAVFKSIINRAFADGFNTVLDGTNASDDIFDRPGTKALNELAVLSPLKMYGYKKSDIRRIAEENGISVFSKPSYACLATRIPRGTPITEKRLELAQVTENIMRNEGFADFRIRQDGLDAKIELSRGDAALFWENRDKLYSMLKPYYNKIFLDLKERDTDG